MEPLAASAYGAEQALPRTEAERKLQANCAETRTSSIPNASSIYTI